MQTNNEYRELMDEARKKHLANIRSVSREIANLYDEAAKDLAQKARKYRKGTLSERWATEYTHQLKKRSKELYSGLYEVTLQGLKRSASYPVSAASDFYSMVGGQSFADALANTPDLVMAEILSGEIYKDKRGLSARIWGTATGLENDVDYIVNRAIAEHKSAVELAADLEEYVQEPAKRSWDWGKVYPNLRGKSVDYNAQRLARTSINHSYWLSNVKACEHNPFVTAMHWELSMSHETRQVIPFGRDCCDDYAEHDEGLGIGNFPVSSLPLPHPQCLCVQWAVIPESLEDIGAEIGNWMAGEPNARLDTWYQKEYGEELKQSEKGDIINAKDIRRVYSQGYRSDEPLTEQQKADCKNYAIQLGFPEESIRFSDDMLTGYSDAFGVERLIIGTDVYPGSRQGTANSRISWRGALAHEIVGHREACLAGKDSDDWKDEVQASIRAARFAPELSYTERIVLLRDAAERAKKEGFTLSQLRDELYIFER